MTYRNALSFAFLFSFATVASAGTPKMTYWPAFGVTVRDNVATFHVEIAEKDSGRMISTSDFDVAIGEWKVIEAKDGERDIKLRARGKSDGSGEVFLEATEKGERIQSNLFTFTPKAAADDARKYNREPITLSLKDADLNDVLQIFGELTGYEIVANKSVAGKKVTISVTDTPWDEALHRIAIDNDLTIKLEGKKIIVE